MLRDQEELGEPLGQKVCRWKNTRHIQGRTRGLGRRQHREGDRWGCGGEKPVGGDRAGKLG